MNDTNNSKPNSSVENKKIKKKLVVRKNKKLTIAIILFVGILLIVSSYAWFSSSLDVRISNFNMLVSSDTGLFISLDGINFSDSVEISKETLIDDLRTKYPSNTNQWASSGLWSVSSNGIRSRNDDKFSVFVGEVITKKRRGEIVERYLNTYYMEENQPNSTNSYLAFDIFLKNVSGSPKSDNLYLVEGTEIFVDTEFEDYENNSMSGIVNSMRIGLLKMGSVPLKASISEIQNIKCNNACEQIIYEPNPAYHSNFSITAAAKYNVNIVNGNTYPTYAMVENGYKLEHLNGQAGTGIPLDTEHFELQKTISSFENPIFQIPNAITKMRVYIWIEGQDVDSLETNSEGANISVFINLEKDLAGYE